MRTMILVLLTTMMLVASARTPRAQNEEVWVNVLIAGKPVMAFIPAPDRSQVGERGVSSEVDEPNARMRDGARVRAFEFRGWKERDGYRVLVLAMVRAETGSLKAVEFDNLLLRNGQQVVLNKMKSVGATPWTIRVGHLER